MPYGIKSGYLRQAATASCYRAHPTGGTVAAVYFVYRSHYEGPLSKRVHTVPDETVLAWFQRGWRCDDPDAWVESELDGEVYGLASIFEASVDEDLPTPATTDELRALLYEHLYVEGTEEYIQLDDHSLRVRTDDDEVQLAYFFFDDVAVATAPERLAYVLHDPWPLPDDLGAAAPFTPDVPVTVVTPNGPGDVTTYAIFLTFYDGESLATSPPLAFPGVGLTALASHLRATDTTAEWPLELSVLRASIAPGEDTIAAALDRCNRWPGFNLSVAPRPPLPAGYDAAHARVLDLIEAAEFTGGRRPDVSLCQVNDHLAQLAMHCGGVFGYQQWYLFDTVWAAAHPDLAQSLLRYASGWDPLAHPMETALGVADFLARD
jgi:hypothetical protein